jgi:tetratricopeptide (TPR) repeat protein
MMLPRTVIGFLIGWLALSAVGMGAEQSTANLEAELDAKLAERRRRTVALGAVIESTGDSKRAVATYEAARRFRDDDLEMLAHLLRFYRMQDDVRGQLSVTQALVRLQPTSLGWLRELGSCYFRLGQRDEAEAAWRRILAAHPLRPAAVRALAQTYEQHGLFDKSVALYREAVAQAPDDPDARLQLAEAQLRAGDGLGALATLVPLAADGAPGRRAAALRESALGKLGFTVRERATVATILDEKPRTAADLAWRLARWFEAESNWSRAVVFFRRVAEDEPDSARGKVAAETVRRLTPKP